MIGPTNLVCFPVSLLQNVLIATVCTLSIITLLEPVFLLLKLEVGLCFI